MGFELAGRPGAQAGPAFASRTGEAMSRPVHSRDLGMADTSCCMPTDGLPLDAGGLLLYNFKREGSVDVQLSCGRLGWLELIANPPPLAVNLTKYLRAE